MKHSEFYIPSCFLKPGFTRFAANDLLDVSIDDPYSERNASFRNDLRNGRFAERIVAFHLNNAAKRCGEHVWMPQFSQHKNTRIKSRDVFATKDGKTYAIEVKTNPKLLQPYREIFVDGCYDYDAKYETALHNNHIPLCTVVVGSQNKNGEYLVAVISDSTIDKWRVKQTKNRRSYDAYLCDKKHWKTFTQLSEWLYPTHETNFGR